ncbi:hypothetical protein BDV3_004874 [Batrachochytrium dendrobatidis]|nr:UBX domain protein Ubx2 [Batrachochytrium dendrobatidis]KAK5670958.1 UBX domain protein Ubx2 [Batrachochytrium dendrobatidis]
MDESSSYADSEALINFIEITGADFETAQRYIEFAQGDAEAAVTLYLESGSSLDTHQSTINTTPISNAPQRMAHTNAEPAVYVGSESTHHNPDPIPARRSILIGDDTEDGNVVDTSYQVRGRAYRSYPNYSTDETSREPFRNIGQETIRETTNANTSDSRQDRLAILFQPPLDIMFQGSFDEARNLARKTGKWLMVAIHDPSEFACQAMNRDLWRNPTVKDLVRENFVFVQFGSQSSEGKMHINFYPIENYPYIGIIDPLTGERIKLWRVQIDPSAFMVEVVEFMDRYQTHLSNEPTSSAAISGLNSASNPTTKQSSKIIDLTEEEQLNLAISASLGEAKTGNRDMANTTSNLNVMPLPSKDDPKYALAVFKQIDAVPYVEPTGSPDTITRIQFRLPNGQKSVYRFLKSDLVRRLFESIKAAHPEITQSFELLHFRDTLLRKMDQTIEQAGLVNVALVVDLFE